MIDFDPPDVDHQFRQQSFDFRSGNLSARVQQNKVDSMQEQLLSFAPLPFSSARSKFSTSQALSISGSTPSILTFRRKLSDEIRTHRLGGDGVLWGCTSVNTNVAFYLYRAVSLYQL